jgi:methylmalonyl-CoA mutase
MIEREGREKLFEEFSPSTYEEWKVAAEKLLKGVPFEKKMYTKTPEGITLEPIYNLNEEDLMTKQENFPGFEKFRRDTQTEGYLNTAWRIMQEEREPLPEKWNANILKSIGIGVDGINVVLSSDTLDGTLPRSEDEVSLDGLNLSCYKGFIKAFEGVELDKYPLHVHCGASSEIFLSMLNAFCKETSFGMHSISGTVGADPVGRLAEKGNLNLSMAEALDSMAKGLKWVNSKAPHLNTILIQTHQYHNAGASAVEELAYAFSTAVFYISEMLDRGLEIDEIAPRMTFSFSISSKFFMEVAKIRAARVLWANVVAAFGGSHDAQKIRIHARTSARTQTVYDPYVNMLRETSQAFSAVMGGVDSLHVSPFDERERIPNDFSKRIAKNVQLILKKECHFTMPIDPVGGTWYIEDITEKLCLKVWDKFQEIEKSGDFLEYLRNGNVHEDLEQVKAFRKREYAIRKSVIVGNNMYPNLEETPLEIEVEKEFELRRTIYDQLSNKKAESIGGIGTGKTIESISEIVMAGATTELVRRYLFSGSEAVRPVDQYFDSEDFEELRCKAYDMKETTGKAPEIFCANFDKLAVHKPRTDFTRGFFEVGGFNVLSDRRFDVSEEGINNAVQAALDSGTNIVVICSSDKVYPEVVVPFITAIKGKQPKIKVILAGKPAKDLEQGYKEAGLDDYIFVKSNIYEMLKNAQNWATEEGAE